MALLHTMSLAGSIAVGIYLMLSFLTKRYLPILWHKGYLTVNIFLFLMPVTYVRSCYFNFLDRYPALNSFVRNENGIEKISDYHIYVYQEGISIPNLPKYIILLVTMLIGICALIFFIIRYKTIYRKITDNAVQFDRGERTLKELEKGHKRPIKSKVYLCPEVKAPITIGTIRRKIVLPDVAWEEGRLADALHHELIHVCVMDNFFKMALILVMILNFYNPLAYYLWYRWNLVTELYCDDKVAENKSIRETGGYAKLIIDFAEMQKTSGLPIVGLSIGEKQLKERIEHLKHLKKTRSNYRKIGNVAGAFIMAVAVFASSLTVFAYRKTQFEYWDIPYEDVIDCYYLGDYTWSEMFFTEEDIKYNPYEAYIHADSKPFFISETGAVCYEGELQTENNLSDALCDHIWIEGTVLEHQEEDSGRCITDFYNGKQCTECKVMVCGDHVYASIFAECPH